jgi:hypothetical protein
VRYFGLERNELVAESNRSLGHGLMVRDALRCRAPHHEGQDDLILRRREAPSRRMKPTVLLQMLCPTSHDLEAGLLDQGGSTCWRPQVSGTMASV